MALQAPASELTCVSRILQGRVRGRCADVHIVDRRAYSGQASYRPGGGNHLPHCHRSAPRETAGGLVPRVARGRTHCSMRPSSTTCNIAASISSTITRGMSPCSPSPTSLSKKGSPTDASPHCGCDKGASRREVGCKCKVGQGRAHEAYAAGLACSLGMRHSWQPQQLKAGTAQPHVTTHIAPVCVQDKVSVEDNGRNLPTA